MTFFDDLKDTVAEERNYLLSSPIILDALAGDITRPQYVAFLKEAYFHVKHTVPLLMACGARLPERLEWLRAAVGEYIEEEKGHQEWILDDLLACGADAEAVRRGTPDPSSELMVALSLWWEVAPVSSAPFHVISTSEKIEKTTTNMASPPKREAFQEGFLWKSKVRKIRVTDCTMAPIVKAISTESRMIAKRIQLQTRVSLRVIAEIWAWTSST